MARILPHDDQDWSDVNRREEPPERVTLPAWGWLALAFVAAFYLRGPLATRWTARPLAPGPRSLCPSVSRPCPFWCSGWC